MSDRVTPPHVVCRRCMTSLDTWQADDGTLTYEHAWAVARVIGTTSDHEPDPVLYDPTSMEIVGVCDFCSEAGPPWEYPCATFAMPDGLPAQSVDGWGACETCHGMIERGDWDALADRSVARFPEARRRMMRRHVRRLHRLFKANRIGEAVGS